MELMPYPEAPGLDFPDKCREDTGEWLTHAMLEIMQTVRYEAVKQLARLEAIKALLNQPTST
jgi:hypothetical protein